MYSAALAFVTPVNEWDALSYHLARVALWNQEHGLGYVENAPDIRLDANPPNAEIGQLATTLLSGSDRYVALPQLCAYAALVVAVAGLARRLGLHASEAFFGALLFATLPVVALQASSGLNDLVVASFLMIAALFALRPGRVSLLLFSLALGLALGTKFTAVLALPTLGMVVVLGRPRREWLRVLMAGVGGLAAGSAWYVVNLVERGELDGGLADTADQRVELSLAAVVTNAMRFALDIVDMSGAAWPYASLFLVAAIVISAAGLIRARRSRSAVGLLAASILTTSPLMTPLVVEIGQRAVFRTWTLLGSPDTAPFERGWGLNVAADTVYSWYGPLSALLLVIAAVAVAALWQQGLLPGVSLALALAPGTLLLTLAMTIVWDPFRGRFLVFGFALAAATWGLVLRSSIVTGAATAIGASVLILSLANYQGKPSGLGDIWAPASSDVSVETIWGDRRSDAQTRLRPGEGLDGLFRYVEEAIPSSAKVTVALREDDFLSPFFGPRLSREISLVAHRGSTVPPDAHWLVLSPRARVRRCAVAWRRDFALEQGWRIERRVAPDRCRL